MLSFKMDLGFFRYRPPADYFPPVEAVAAATSVFTEYVFCESVDSAHISQISSTFQEVDCLLKLVKVNKTGICNNFIKQNLNHTAQRSISQGEIIIFVSRAGGNNGKDPWIFFNTAAGYLFEVTSVCIESYPYVGLIWLKSVPFSFSGKKCREQTVGLRLVRGESVHLGSRHLFCMTECG